MEAGLENAETSTLLKSSLEDKSKRRLNYEQGKLLRFLASWLFRQIPRIASELTGHNNSFSLLPVEESLTS